MIILLMLCITNCAHKEPLKETIRICESDGCTDRPHDYSSFDPAKDSSQEALGEKIAALEELAAHDSQAAYDLALRFFQGRWCASR
jgi:hypothetical protein